MPHEVEEGWVIRDGSTIYVTRIAVHNGRFMKWIVEVTSPDGLHETRRMALEALSRFTDDCAQAHADLDEMWSAIDAT